MKAQIALVAFSLIFSVSTLAEADFLPESGAISTVTTCASADGAVVTIKQKPGRANPSMAFEINIPDATQSTNAGLKNRHGQAYFSYTRSPVTASSPSRRLLLKDASGDSAVISTVISRDADHGSDLIPAVSTVYDVKIKTDNPVWPVIHLEATETSADDGSDKLDAKVTGEGSDSVPSRIFEAGVFNCTVDELN